MTTWAIIVIVVVAMPVAWVLFLAQPGQRLRSKFGPEYQRTITELGDGENTDHHLEARQADRARFVEHPWAAVVQAGEFDLRVDDELAAFGML